MFCVAEECRSSAVFQQLGQLVGVQRSVERDHRASRCNDAEIRSHPARMVIRHNGQARSARKSVFVNPPSHGFRHAVELSVGATLDLIVALEFQGDVRRPAVGALDKAVVESGHESCGIYTKNPFTAERAEIAERSRENIPWAARRPRSARRCISSVTWSSGPSSASNYARLKEKR